VWLELLAGIRHTLLGTVDCKVHALTISGHHGSSGKQICATAAEDGLPAQLRSIRRVPCWHGRLAALYVMPMAVGQCLQWPMNHGCDLYMQAHYCKSPVLAECTTDQCWPSRATVVRGSIKLK
jgi:hypothetical protein